QSALHCIERRSRFDRRALRRFIELCRRERIDLIHTHDASSQLFAAIIRVRHPRSAPPVLMTFHPSLDLEPANWRHRLRKLPTFGLTGAVATVSHERRGHYLDQNHVNPCKVVCIPNGIDLDRYRTCPTERADARRELRATEHTVVVGAVGHFG